MEVTQPRRGDAVAAGVLRPVGQERAVRADGRRHQHTRVRVRHVVAYLLRDGHAPGDQAPRLGRVVARSRQPFDAGLVARRRRDPGAGLDVGAVRVCDPLRRLAEQTGRPQRPAEVDPLRLQGRREPAVEQDGYVVGSSGQHEHILPGLLRSVDWGDRSRVRSPPPPDEADGTTAYGAATILPRSPCDSSSGPALNSSSEVFAALPLPKRRPHSPSMAIGRPCESRS